MSIRIAENAGFCPGVRRAVEAVESAIREVPRPKRILTLGQLIHNDAFLATLAARGIRQKTILSPRLRKCERSRQNSWAR